MKKRNSHFWKALFLGFLVGVAGWAAFMLVLWVFETFLGSVGISEQPWNYLAMITIAITMMIVFGLSWRRSLKKIFRG